MLIGPRGRSGSDELEQNFEDRVGNRPSPSLPSISMGNAQWIMSILVLLYGSAKVLQGGEIGVSAPLIRNRLLCKAFCYVVMDLPAKAIPSSTALLLYQNFGFIFFFQILSVWWIDLNCHCSQSWHFSNATPTVSLVHKKKNWFSPQPEAD